MQPELRLDLPPTWRRCRPPAGVVWQAQHGEGEHAARVTITLAEPSSAGVEVETLARALTGFALIDQGTVTGLANRPCDWLVGRYLARDRHPTTLSRWSAVVDGWRITVTATIPSRRHDDLIDEVAQAVDGLRLAATAA